MNKYEPYIYDIEAYGNFFCCTFLSLRSDASKTYVIDDGKNEASELAKAIKNTYLIGYNNKSYDNVVINYILKNPRVTAEQIFEFSDRLIRTMNKDNPRALYKAFGEYMQNGDYKSLDLMRMLFSKKLRVSLKELECSLNFKNVEDLPYPVGAILDEKQKQKVIEYNFNDCEATKLVAEKSIPDIKLRTWTKKHFGVDGYNLDGVNLGVKLLEEKLAEKLGHREFTERNSNRKKVDVEEVIYPFIKFETPEFQAVHKRFVDMKCYKYFDKNKGREVWNKIGFQPQIGSYIFKYGIGGLHFETRPKAWHSNDEYEILSVDVNSYYPAQLIEYPEICKPEHLPEEFVGVYKEVRDERLIAKAEGDTIKSDTYKLSINGAFGNFSNEYSWLCDPKALMAITVNGQLMLSMLCEKLMMNNIVIIDANTDGIYAYIHKSQKEKFKEICADWQKLTRMELEETRFESMYFLTTGDYFGTYLKKGKVQVKEKGCFITDLRLGKGMEFPIIYKAVKEYFLYGKDFTSYIRSHDSILDFCSFKKLKKQYTCFWKGETQQRVNRFYASRTGAHLYARKWVEKSSKFQIGHVLKDSPVQLLNRLDEKPINQRDINWSFYLSKAREIVTTLEGDRGQLKLF